MSTMKAILGVGCALTVSAGAFGQGGQGREQGTYDDSITRIEHAISAYLNVDEIKNILSPGEYSEWPLSLKTGQVVIAKTGQVVIAEARSDAFDPALEIVDSGGKVLISNDDRYPGDQRPLLLWRCAQDGAYKLRAMCFHDRSGGQFFLRYKVYDEIDLEVGKVAEKACSGPTDFLCRITMKGGDVRRLTFETPNEEYAEPTIGATISSTGLPDIDLARPFDAAVTNSLMAPVDGDYYVLALDRRSGNCKMRIGLQAVTPATLAAQKGQMIGSAKTGMPAVWALPVKAGQVLEARACNLDPDCRLIVGEKPDISKFDISKNEKNPFFPKSKEQQPSQGPAIVSLPARARDQRIAVFVAERDTTLWVATDGQGPAKKQYTVSVIVAPRSCVDGQDLKGQLRIGNTDYWAFEAKSGDVMAFNTSATNFAERTVVLDPNLAIVWSGEAGPDQAAMSWNYVVSTPGRYLVAISALGNGGGGSYSLLRRVFPAKEFAIGSPASGQIDVGGPVQVWKFAAKPGQPLLIHWKSSNPSYSLAMRNDLGEDVFPAVTRVDNQSEFSILTVNKPSSFLVVLVPNGTPATYSIELSHLPGYAKGG